MEARPGKAFTLATMPDCMLCPPSGRTLRRRSWWCSLSLSDHGLHWTPVIVEDGDIRLSGTITGIESLGGNSIRLKVQSEVGWVTSDGGRHWRRE